MHLIYGQNLNEEDRQKIEGFFLGEIDAITKYSFKTKLIGKKTAIEASLLVVNSIAESGRFLNQMRMHFGCY